MVDNKRENSLCIYAPIFMQDTHFYIFHPGSFPNVYVFETIHLYMLYITLPKYLRLYNSLFLAIANMFVINKKKTSFM